MTGISKLWFPGEYASEQGNIEMFQVKCDSMTGADIRDGALLCIRLQPHADDGQIVVATIPCDAGNGRVVKRYREIDGHKWLYSENPAYPPVPADDAVITGVVLRWMNWV
jgi:repressor LexA